MKRFCLLVLTTLTCWQTAFAAPEDKAVVTNQVENHEERIRDLEQQLNEINSWQTNFYILGKGRVSPILGSAISLGGFFDTTVTHINGLDTKTQTSGNSHALGINLSVQFSEKTKFVTQYINALYIPLRNINNNPDFTPPQRTYGGVYSFSIVAQGYLEHRFSEFFNVQLGLGYVPFGIAYQQREPVLFKVRSGLQILTYQDQDRDTVGIASPLWMGIHIFGVIPHNEKTGYNLYTLTPVTALNTVGVGGRLWHAINENAKIGASVQSGKQVKGSYFTHGFDIELNYQKYGLISEYAYSSYSQNYLDTEYYYFEPYLKFADDEWIFFLNGEYMNTPERTDLFTHLPDPVKSWRYGGGVNWLPLANVRIRLHYLIFDYLDDNNTIKGQRRDYNALEFSTGIAF